MRLDSLFSAALALLALQAQGQVTVSATAGTDFGATVTQALATTHGTVRIPAGSYTFKTTIVHPGDGHRLECDAGTTLNFAGTGDAITLAQGNLAANQVAGIDGDGGCMLAGAGPQAGQNGVHIFPSNHTYLRDLRIRGFAVGIYNTGGNSIQITNVSVFQNGTGILLTGLRQGGTGFAPNAVHLSDSNVAFNKNWGLVSEPSAGAGGSDSLGNVFRSNVFEGNGSGDIRLAADHGTVISENYFESSGPAVSLGVTGRVVGVYVMHNHITAGSGSSPVLIGPGAVGVSVEENEELLPNKASGCFVEDLGARGRPEQKAFRGAGTNQIADPHEWCAHGSAAGR